jgi:hypothetical protein
VDVGERDSNARAVFVGVVANRRPHPTALVHDPGAPAGHRTSAHEGAYHPARYSDTHLNQPPSHVPGGAADRHPARELPSRVRHHVVAGRETPLAAPRQSDTSHRRRTPPRRLPRPTSLGEQHEAACGQDPPRCRGAHPGSCAERCRLGSGHRRPAARRRCQHGAPGPGTPIPAVAFGFAAVISLCGAATFALLSRAAALETQPTPPPTVAEPAAPASTRYAAQESMQEL